VSADPAPADLMAALHRLLSAEHAAVYGYGLVGARLTLTEEAGAAAALAAHQNRRDAVIRLIRDQGGTPVAALPAYVPKRPLIDRPAAIQLAVTLEEDCAAACTGVVSATVDPSIRRTAAGWLTDVAVRDELWRARLGAAALAGAPPLPGLVPPAPTTAPTSSQLSSPNG